MAMPPHCHRVIIVVNNSIMIQEQKQKIEFTDRAIENFVSFFDCLARIHERLAAEGYKIKDGVLIAPGAVKNNDLCYNHKYGEDEQIQRQIPDIRP